MNQIHFGFAFVNKERTKSTPPKIQTAATERERENVYTCINQKHAFNQTVAHRTISKVVFITKSCTIPHETLTRRKWVRACVRAFTHTHTKSIRLGNRVLCRRHEMRCERDCLPQLQQSKQKLYKPTAHLMTPIEKFHSIQFHK